MFFKGRSLDFGTKEEVPMDALCQLIENAHDLHHEYRSSLTTLCTTLLQRDIDARPPRVSHLLKESNGAYETGCVVLFPTLHSTNSFLKA